MLANMTNHTFLDVEASGLDEPSYPIQIGWVDASGEHDEFLVNPESTKDWSHWDRYAQSHVHKIPRERCVAKGLSVYDAARRLNNLLGTLIVISDAVDNDAYWVGKLFLAAGLEPTFDMVDVRDVLFANGGNIGDFIDERRCHYVLHHAVSDCVRNIKSGAASGCWSVGPGFIDEFGDVNQHAVDPNKIK